jgi:hypothetical protein
MADVVLLTVVASQGESDVICSLLRANGIECGERSATGTNEGGRWGGYREVLVSENDLEWARELIASRDPARSEAPRGD